ncbi:MAG: hypothetical protein IJU45_06680, partial [Clostridia bacterium]|nr:hypothetical protein [Clostridia bacterium]
VIDDKGIVDAEGHRIYSTGQKNDKGDTIYTTGKKDKDGNVLYTLNKTDDRGHLIYYTAKEKDGKLELTQTQAVPDYTTDKNSELDRNSRYTTTPTVTMAESKNTAAEGLTKLFTKYSNSTGQDQFRKIVAAKKGGYIVTGISSSGTGLYKDASSEWKNFAHIIKFDAQGNEEWTYVTGGDGDVQFADVAELKDGSIVAVGYTAATDTDSPLHSKYISSLIVKVDKNGKYLWSYSFPGDEENTGDEAYSVAALDDGGFVVGGRAQSTSGFFTGSDALFKAYLFKFDKNGKIDWRKTLNGSKGNSITALCTNSDGDIFAACVTHSTDGSFASIKGYGTLSNTVIMKLNKSGKILWTSNIVGSGESEYKAICPTADGGCIAGGKMSVNKRADGSYSMSYGATDGYVVRLSKDGEVYWGRNVGGSLADSVTGVAYTDKGIVVIGKTKSSDGDFKEYPVSGENDGFIMILNESGQTVYTEKLEGKLEDTVLDVIPTEKGVVAVGWSSSADGSFSESKAKKTAEGYIVSYEFK